MILFFGEKRFLSIDFGSINIKIVECRRKESKIEITNFGVIPIINFKEILTTSHIVEETIASILRNFIKEAKIQTNQIFVSVPAPYVFPVNFLIPNIPSKNIPQVIKFEAQKQIPLALEEIEIEYNYLEIEKENKHKEYLVFLTAIPKNYIQRIENIAKLSKLRLDGYSSEYLNLEPYFWQAVGNYGIIDLGHSYSIISLVKDGRLIFSNRLKLRGFDYLSMIHDLTKYPEDKVLEFVQAKGFIFNPEEVEIKSMAQTFLDNLYSVIINEIKNLEDKFLMKINKIYLTGGVCLLPGFKEAMLQRFQEISFEILSPANFVEGNKFKRLEEKSCLFSQAIGILMKKLLS